MAKKKPKTDLNGLNVEDYRHSGAKRKNNPPAKIAAEGTVPAMPKMFKIDTPRVMDSTGALALEEVPKSLLVVGGGYIGLEMGTVYAELGSAVTVVELLEGLLPGADRDLVKPLEKRLRERFAGVHLGTKVVELTNAGEKVDVRVEGPEFNGTHSFDRVLVSIGRRPMSCWRRTPT